MFDLNHLRFADDVVLIAKNEKELSAMAEDLRRRSEDFGLSINTVSYTHLTLPTIYSV